MAKSDFEELVRKYPTERSAIQRLEALLGTLRPEDEYTFDYLFDHTAPRSFTAFSLLLGELVNRGLISKVIRVESPTRHGGIKDFASITDVPDELYDWRSDQRIRVTPHDIRMLYKAS
jgi:hypothetical protein